MELQLRERGIFDTLKKLNSNFVVIGGYAVNAYTLPRFSVDCDVVVKNKSSAKKIGKQLLGMGYFRATTGKSHYGDFARYEKKIKEHISSSVDVLVKEVVDRQTGEIFSAKWVFENSEIRILKGKTISERFRVRIINLDALVVMKIISCRAADIRDVFMLAPAIKDTKWVKQEVANKYDFDDRFSKILNTISSEKFRDGLQGVFGRIHEKTFEMHKKAILKLRKRL